MTEQNEYDLDLILYVLENPIRRRILRMLARENNYPLQLSRELNVSQQAIMKHLKVLEESDFVESYEEPSTKGGPPRRIFSPRKRYCIRIDIGPNTYSEEIQSYKDYEARTGQDWMGTGYDRFKVEISGKVTGEIKSDIAGSLPAFIDSKLENLRLQLERILIERDDMEKLKELLEFSNLLDKEISKLEEKRIMIISFKERVNEEINNISDNITKS